MRIRGGGERRTKRKEKKMEAKEREERDMDWEKDKRKRREAVMGKHPDLMVAHPTSTIFPTIGRNFEIS
jgi:hypothetical protein